MSRNTKKPTAQALTASLPNGQWLGSYGVASCPVKGHGKGRGDLNPSLSITDGKNGAAFKCHAGCDSRAVWRAVTEASPRLFMRHDQKQKAPASKPPRNATPPPKKDAANSKTDRTARAMAIWQRSAAGHEATHRLSRYLIARSLATSREHAHAIANAITCRYDARHHRLAFPITNTLTGETTAIHTIATARGEDGHYEKRTHGFMNGGGVLIGTLSPSRPLIIAEGIEDAIASLILLQTRTQTKATALAILGTGNASNIAIPTPDTIASLIFFLDNDRAGNEATTILERRGKEKEIKTARTSLTAKDPAEQLASINKKKDDIQISAALPNTKTNKAFSQPPINKRGMKGECYGSA